jgi:hypothetical protein
VLVIAAIVAVPFGLLCSVGAFVLLFGFVRDLARLAFGFLRR